MRCHAFSLLLTATGIAVVNSLPIARQQALIEIQSGEVDVTQLLADIVQSNFKAAKIEYAIVQKDLDNLGMYLGQLTGPTCVSTSPSSNTTSAVTQLDVLETLQLLQADMINISAGIVNNTTNAAVSAYTAAQGALESTYSYIFA